MPMQYPWQQEQQLQPEPEQQQPIGPSPEWNREKFRDAWMGSGMRNVGDMNKWLQSSGWGQHINTGGSKGDKMYLPGGDVIDAVFAAGAGGNRAGPMWTGAGNWQQGQQGRQMPGGKPGIGPQQPPGGWGMGGQMPGGFGTPPYAQMMGGGFGQNPAMQQNQMHQQWRNQQQQRQRYPQNQQFNWKPQQQQMKQPNYQQQQNRMYY